MVEENTNNQIHTRNSNMELLRILCMLMIVAGHVIMVAKFQSVTMDRIFCCGIRPFFMVAVNCFVLISGWFGIQFAWKKLLHLNNLTTFYSLTVAAIMVFVGGKMLNALFIFKMAFPIVTRQYWFITVYAALFLLAPLLNVFVNKMGKDDFKKLLLILFFLFVILPTFAGILNFQSITLDSGYGITNFVFLYLLGRYMRLYHQPKKNAFIYFLWYFFVAALGGLFQVIYSYIVGFQFTTLLSYDTLFVFVSALMLFCGFTRLDFKSNVVNYVASFSLPVYIIHIHPLAFEKIFLDIFGLSTSTDQNFVFYLFLLPFTVYTLCMFVELVRRLGCKYISLIFRAINFKINQIQ